MTDNIRTIIAREIKAYRHNHGRVWMNHFLNNFHLVLPDNNQPEGGFYRGVLKGVYQDGNTLIHVDSLDRWNLPNRVYYLTKRSNPPETMSNRKILATPQEFFLDIDLALRTERTNLSSLQRFQSDRTMHGSNDFFRLVFPAYVRLRAMGYSHGDLTA